MFIIRARKALLFVYICNHEMGGVEDNALRAREMTFLLRCKSTKVSHEYD